jgi:hypothetical protein
MIDWVAKKTDKDVKKDVDKVDEIVHDNNMTISEALTEYKKLISDDYKRFIKAGNFLNQETVGKEFEDGLDYNVGSKYIKVIRKDNQTSVHSFIVNTDKDKKFKYGDILKAASWNAPARNFARGNVFGKYKVRWVGM